MLHISLVMEITVILESTKVSLNSEEFYLLGFHLVYLFFYEDMERLIFIKT